MRGVTMLLIGWMAAMLMFPAQTLRATRNVGTTLGGVLHRQMPPTEQWIGPVDPNLLLVQLGIALTALLIVLVIVLVVRLLR